MSVRKFVQGAWVPVDSDEQEAWLQAGDEPEDLEALSLESAWATPVRKGFLLSSLLGLSFYALLELDKENDEGFVVKLTPPEYVRTIRTAARITPAQLDERIGRDAGFIDGVEAGDIDLLTHPARLAYDIAQGTRSSTYRLLKVLEQASWALPMH